MSRVATKCALPRRGFSLIELLVALAVFAIMAALAYGGLNSIARTRSELGVKETAFRDLMRAVSVLDRDLGQTVARPVRGNFGQSLPAFIGTSDHMEFTRMGFANPQAEPRSNLERVLYELDASTLKRGHWTVLDRAPGSDPQIVDLQVKAVSIRFQYLAASQQWLDAWPPPQTSDASLLPRAVQWTLRTQSDGELSGVVQMVSAWPTQAADAVQAAGGGIAPLPGLPPPPGAAK